MAHTGVLMIRIPRSFKDYSEYALNHIGILNMI